VEECEGSSSSSSSSNSNSKSNSNSSSTTSRLMFCGQCCVLRLSLETVSGIMWSHVPTAAAAAWRQV
jgi:hypothetical protein